MSVCFPHHQGPRLVFLKGNIGTPGYVDNTKLGKRRRQLICQLLIN